MKNKGWVTLSAERFHIGTMIRVTGGRMWGVGEDPRKDWSHMPRNEHGTLTFSCAGQVRETIKTRVEDMEVWRH
jgi:hypothetical protein